MGYPFALLDVARLASRPAEAAANPPGLYLRGNLPRAPGIAVVGTRKPTPAALDFCRSLVADLAEQGCAIWSGGAKGIDRAAHESALEAGAPTVVVAPSGLKRPYPTEHRELYRHVIRAGGAMLSLWPDSTEADRPLFFRRNHALAALTTATVVVEAPCRSGARSTARAARLLGRLLCVVPHAPWSASGAGCAIELTLGARAIRNAADVMRLVRGLGQPNRQPSLPGVRTAAGLESTPAPPVEATARLPVEPLGFRDEKQQVTPEQLRLIQALGDTPTHIDELCAATDLSFSEVARALLTLTLLDVVVEGPTGHYRRLPR